MLFFFTPADPSANKLGISKICPTPKKPQKVTISIAICKSGQSLDSVEQAKALIYIIITTSNWYEYRTYLHHEFFKALVDIDSSLGAAFNKQASVFPCKVDPFFFANDPLAFL